MTNDLRDVRLQKVRMLREMGLAPYTDHYTVTHSLRDAGRLADGQSASVAGRLMALRKFGKLIFGHIEDASGSMQISLERAALTAKEFDVAKKLIDIGDFVGLSGELWTTQTGEKTVRAMALTLLAKGLRPLPEKWHGLVDGEIRSRKRYLDLISNGETRSRFVKRSRIISFIRLFLESRGFLEVETPVLQSASSGASARPFVTHHNALNRDLYLRISPETYLKRLIVGGMERVYEIGKNFRNEGIDPSHLQEFTMLEWYAAYWSYRENMALIRELVQALLTEFCGGTRVEYQGTVLDFGGEWAQIDYCDCVKNATGLDLLAYGTREDLVLAAVQHGVQMKMEDYTSLPALTDAIYKKMVRPQLIQPTFLMHHPAELVPLARRSSENARVLDMFQVVVNSWELVKAYSELIDPLEQDRRMRLQQVYRDAGDDETMMREDDYIECMEYGMPPNSGLGLGIDRMVAIVTGAESLRDVVFFPSMREEADQGATIEPAPFEREG